MKEKFFYAHFISYSRIATKENIGFFPLKSQQHQFLKVINALECERTEEIDHIDQSEFDVRQIPSQTFLIGLIHRLLQCFNSTGFS